MKAMVEQPAKKSYWFDRGFPDIQATVERAWAANKASASDMRAKSKVHDDESTPKKWFFKILYLFGLVSIYIFGSIVTGIVVTINTLVVLLLMLFVYIGFSIVWIFDRLYLKIKSIFTACHACKEKSLIPAYKCPQCGALHTQLFPSVYGILKRECIGETGAGCGYKLPTNFFGKGDAVAGFNDDKKIRRRELEGQCGNPNCRTPLYDRETRPIVIPIVGGRSVGKTAFITAFSHDFVTQVAPDHQLEIEEYNREKVAMFEEMKRAYRTSDFALTPAQNTSGTMSGISSISYSFFVKNPQLKPDRLIHIYDIAGEYFTNVGGEEKEVQKQYEYCHGLVLIVDLLSIQQVFDRYESEIDAIDRDRRGTADLTETFDVLINKLREVTGLSSKQMHKVPLAVVISKTDAVAEVDQELSYDSALALQKTDEKKFKTVYDAMDWQCREFLRDNGMRHFIASINLNFANNRYFSASPIGHTAMSGSFQPKGVMPVMEWLVESADPALAKLWDDYKFSKRPIGMKEIK